MIPRPNKRWPRCSSNPKAHEKGAGRIVLEESGA
jgi:hypothetical protein